MKSQPITLWIIRAGETVWAADGRLRGTTDLPMSQQGRTSVEHDLALWTGAKPAIIHHPADEAAAETAQRASQQCKAKLRAVAELGEPNLGMLEGLTEQEFEERFPSRHKQWEDDSMSFAAPEGEEMASAALRILKAVVHILKKTRSQETAIVLHDIALGLLRCRLAGRSLNEWRSMVESHPRVERVELSPGMIDVLKNQPVEQQQSS